MNDLQIRYFLELVNNGISFTKAAQAVYISQPALSKHIRNLEQELGVKLFDTANRSQAKLTPAGTLFYQFFSRSKADLKNITDQAKLLESQSRGKVLIAGLELWDMGTILPEISTFYAAYPNIDISFTWVEIRSIRNSIIDNSYDLAISTRLPFEGLENVFRRHLYDSPMVCLYSKNHPLASKEHLQFSDFKDAAFFELENEANTVIRQNHEAYCRARGFTPNIRLKPNLDSIVLAIESGCGGMIFDQAAHIVNHSSFRYIVLEESVPIFAIWKQDNQNPALELFIRECVGEGPQGAPPGLASGSAPGPAPGSATNHIV
ncbi:MAG: LysR family transcriptional regulator [Treponema sp.]|jgi:DNA-binding transcriptional LysR family regulator|nr:LysR family transcriptional regulator [Treponema sp.]